MAPGAANVAAPSAVRPSGTGVLRGPGPSGAGPKRLATRRRHQGAPRPGQRRFRDFRRLRKAKAVPRP